MAEKNENSVGIVQTRTIRLIEPDKPLTLENGKTIAPVDAAYETYGQINERCDNAILICHALSGNAHAAGLNSPDDQKPGWWDSMIGPGKAIDTNKYFVICSNFLGGCGGTTGPSSTNHDTGKPYGLDFPIITIADMVKLQKMLLDKLGIKKLLAVIGGSIGGMQTLQWAIDYPDFVKAVIPIATTSRLSPQSIAFDAVGRNAILADPDFAAGQYHNKKNPANGLSIARMIGHITYLSEQGMREKFGRELQTTKDYRYDFDSEFAVETYLDHQGEAFVERFDANSYLYITKAADYFDLQKSFGSLEKAFAQTKSRFLVVGFTSDWLFSPAQSEQIVNALLVNDKNVSYCNINSPFGHDAFLLETETLGLFICSFLDKAYRSIVKAGLIDTCCLSQKNPLPNNDPHQASRTRLDYDIIESLIEPNTTVLDVGCGDGELLARLAVDKNVKAKGIELVEELVLISVARGLDVIQHDIERGLESYADKSFDVLILSQTLQTVKNPQKVFIELLRIGKKVIVSFPNFAYWKCRAQLFFKGHAPVAEQLPFEWHDSPNIHFLSLKDFERFCNNLGVTIEKKIPLLKNRLSPVKFVPNFFAEQAVYVTKKQI